MTVTNIEAVAALMLELKRLDEARKRGPCKVTLHVTAGRTGGAACSIAFPPDDALSFVQRCIEANNADLARFGVEVAKAVERNRPAVPAWGAKPAEVLKFPRAVEPDADGAA